jgi:hypothetical protein
MEAFDVLHPARFSERERPMFRPRTVAAAAVLLFLVTPGTRADISVPGSRQVTPYLRFDNLDNYPDYRLYLQYRRGDGNPLAAPLQIVEVFPGRPVAVAGEGRRVADLALLAAPRDQELPAFPRQTWGPAPEFPGFLRATILEHPVTTTSVADAASHYVSAYRVAIKDGKLEVTALPVEGVYPGDRAGRAILPYWPAVAALAAAVFAGAGVWFARRRAARARPAAPPAASPPE